MYSCLTSTRKTQTFEMELYSCSTTSRVELLKKFTDNNDVTHTQLSSFWQTFRFQYTRNNLVA